MAHLKTHSCFFVKAIPRQKNFLPMTFCIDGSQREDELRSNLF